MGIKSAIERLKLNTFNVRTLFEGLIYSTLLIHLTSGLKIIDPRQSGWLSDGDGTSEIAWEFFRRTPLVQFPLGINPKYGLEISSSVVLDGQIPLFSLLLRPFSPFLTERFQYFGLFIFLTFTLNYYVSKKIFEYLNFKNIDAAFSGLILATSPIILNRFIDTTHYSLSSGWIIFYSILLVLKSDFKTSNWMMLSALAVLIHFYFLPFILTIYLVANFYNSQSIKLILKKTVDLLYILISTGSIMLIVGYFQSGSSSKDVGYGFFRSTLTSIIDPSGWSSIIPDIPETEGSYEGFAYLGLPVIFLITLGLILKKKSINRQYKAPFTTLWIVSTFLFLFSLSNNIAYSNKELISLPNLEFFSIITSTFRSSGRFSWLIAFVITIYSIYSVSQKLKGYHFTFVLLLSLIVGFIDYYPQLTSEKNDKFQLQFNSKLTQKAWNSISECYSNIRVYPPTPAVENYYDFVKVANSQGLGINTGRFGRINQAAILGSYDLMHREFNSGSYRNNTFYVFGNSEYVSQELVKFQKNLAIHTLNSNSAYGELNGYTFIAPNLKSCTNGEDIKTSSTGFGSPENQKYRGEKLFFGKNTDSSKYILRGFSNLEDWGVWSATADPSITLHTVNAQTFTSISFVAREWAESANQFKVSLNGDEIGSCKLSIDFSVCSIPFNAKSFKTNIINVSFTPLLIRDPNSNSDSSGSENFGFGLQSLYLS
jgi:hypothetical protein